MLVQILEMIYHIKERYFEYKVDHFLKHAEACCHHIDLNMF